MSSSMPEHGGNRIEHLPGQAQLAGAMDLRMAGQHLLDQRGAGARQAEDEHRQRVSSPAPASRPNSSGVKPAIRRSTKRACSAGSYVRPCLRRCVQGQGVGLRPGRRRPRHSRPRASRTWARPKSRGPRGRRRARAPSSRDPWRAGRRRAACRAAASPAGPAVPAPGDGRAEPAGKQASASASSPSSSCRPPWFSSASTWSGCSSRRRR